VAKAEFSGQDKSSDSIKDIPEALRNTPNAQTGSRSYSGFLIGGLIGLGAIALVTSLWYISAPRKNTAGLSSGSTSTAVTTPKKVNPATSTETLLGHFAYSEAPQKELKPIVPKSSIKLRKAAATKFQAMVIAARTKGVVLVPISGFRSIASQQHLFFDVKAQRGQVATKRATVSAPPGYSEHHTGYAVDIGDGTAPATNLNPKFEKTRAFKWLSANAAHFSFEMSFPKKNPQGVTYEPWHWRYVGDRHSLETFYKAKNLNTNTPK
jgi:D-alanyl-D-alanine carboxypeptidase